MPATAGIVDFRCEERSIVIGGELRGDRSGNQRHLFQPPIAGYSERQLILNNGWHFSLRRPEERWSYLCRIIELVQCSVTGLPTAWSSRAVMPDAVIGRITRNRGVPGCDASRDA